MGIIDCAIGIDDNRAIGRTTDNGDAGQIQTVIGKKTNKAIPADSLILEEDLE